MSDDLRDRLAAALQAADAHSCQYGEGTEVRARAKKAGWTVRNKPGYTRLDYCPDHSKES